MSTSQDATTEVTAKMSAIARGWNRYRGYAGHIMGLFLCGFLFFPSSQSHNAFFYGALLLPLLFIALREALLLARSNWLALACFVLIGYMCSSAIWNPDFDGQEVLRTFKYGIINIAFIGLMVWLMEHERSSLLFWLRYCPLLFTIGGLLAAVLWYGDHPFPAKRLYGWGRVEYPVHLSAVCSLGIAVALGCYSRASQNLRLIYAVCIPTLLLVIILTQSLLGLLTAVVVTLPYLKINVRRAMLLLVPATAVLGIIAIAYPGLLPSIFNDDGGWARIDIWRHVIQGSHDSWLFGHGLKADFDYLHYFPEYDTSLLFNRAHNVYLACLFQGGVIGFFGCLATVLAGLYVLLRKAIEDNDYLYFTIMLLGAVAIAGDWSHLIDQPNLLYLFLWLPLAIAMVCINERQSRASASAQ